MYVYRPDFWMECKVGSLKLFLESYFDMSMAVLVGFAGYNDCKDASDFFEFFFGFGNILNTVLTFVVAIALVCFIMY